MLLECSKSTPPLFCPELSLRAAHVFSNKRTCGLAWIGLGYEFFFFRVVPFCSIFYFIYNTVFALYPFTHIHRQKLNIFLDVQIRNSIGQRDLLCDFWPPIRGAFEFFQFFQIFTEIFEFHTTPWAYGLTAFLWLTIFGKFHMTDAFLMTSYGFYSYWNRKNLPVFYINSQVIYFSSVNKVMNYQRTWYLNAPNSAPKNPPTPFTAIDIVTYLRIFVPVQLYSSGNTHPLLSALYFR